jgi:ribosome-associated translation inhibitor RaiA
MQVPLQVTFENIEHSDTIEACINGDWKKLEPFSDGITSARVVVGRPQHRHHKGDSYQVRIHLTVASGTDIVINRDPDVTDAHDDVYVTIRDAFKAARRQLQDLAGKRH